MLELTKQEKRVIVFLLATALLGIGALCYKSLVLRPKIEVISNQDIDRRAALNKIININTAGRQELMRLSGIGKALAERIIAYRDSRGGFRALEELKDVNGIGPAKFDKIKDRVKIE